MAQQDPFSPGQSARYGLLGLPLAFVALPLYVLLPNHYAREFAVPLAWLGAVLLGARLFDAVIDPLLGRWSDRLFARSTRAVLGVGGAAGLVLLLGFVLLFFPPTVVRASQTSLLIYASAMLVVTYAAYSLLSVMHQAWAAMHGGSEAERSRIVAWREGLGLLGVVTASVLPTVAGLGPTSVVFGVCLAVGWWAWTRCVAPRPQPTSPQAASATWLWRPLANPAFRRLLAVFVLNGIASAVPATLVLFFVQDRLQAPASMEPAFLGTYFVAAAASIPLWLALVRRVGLARTWLVGMLLAIAVFVWASQLGAGDAWAFVLVCALSGVALGTDLAMPGAMLAGVIAQGGDRGQAEGAYFGWWNFAIKLNLALAAGLALPLLGLFGYEPGTRDPQALQALTLAYCLLPCALKLLAAAGLYGLVIRAPAPSEPIPLPSLQKDTP
jgi:GPH family glycoside/pentoside/hexuronide:cation symporter